MNTEPVSPDRNHHEVVRKISLVALVGHETVDLPFIADNTRRRVLTIRLEAGVHLDYEAVRPADADPGYRRHGEGGQGNSRDQGSVAHDHPFGSEHRPNEREALSKGILPREPVDFDEGEANFDSSRPRVSDSGDRR